MLKKLFAKLMSFREKPKVESGEEKFNRERSQESALAKEREEAAKRSMAEKQKKTKGPEPEKEVDLTEELGKLSEKK